MSNITFPDADWIMHDGNLCAVYIDWECRGSEFYHEVYLLNKKNEIAGHFQSKGCLSVSALSDLNDNILEYKESVWFGDNEGISRDKHQIIRVNPDLSYEVLHDIEYIESGIEDGTFAIRKNGLYGFIDYNGIEFIKPQYEEYYHFCLGIACVKKDGKWGFINKQNEVVIPFGLYDMNDSKERYMYRPPAIYEDRILIPVQTNNRWGVIDTGNNTVISFQYEDIWCFGDYFIAKKCGKLGVIDINENIILPFEYDESDTYNDHPDFMAISQNGLVGLLDKNINIAIPIIYKEIEMDEEDNSILARKQNGKSVLLDFCGNEITEEFDYISNCFEGMYIAGNGDTKSNAKYAFMTEKGEFVTGFEYDKHPEFFHAGLCIAERYGRFLEDYDVINTKGEILYKIRDGRKAFNLGNGCILVEVRNKNKREFTIKKLL